MHIILSAATLLLLLLNIYSGFVHAASTETGFSYDRHIGFVTYKNGETVLSIENNDLKKGHKLLVMYRFKGNKPLLIPVKIIERLPAGTAGHNVATSSERKSALYKIDHPQMEAVAFVPVAGISKYDTKKHTIDIDGDGKNENLYTCTSMEGVHFMVRSGHPRTGVLRKDFYHYLGYDVEPSCQDSDYM